MQDLINDSKVRSTVLRTPPFPSQQDQPCSANHSSNPNRPSFDLNYFTQIVRHINRFHVIDLIMISVIGPRFFIIVTPGSCFLMIEIIVSNIRIFVQFKAVRPNVTSIQLDSNNM